MPLLSGFLDAYGRKKKKNSVGDLVLWSGGREAGLCTDAKSMLVF